MRRRIRPYATIPSLAPFASAEFNAYSVSGVTRANDHYRHYVVGPTMATVLSGSVRQFSFSLWLKQVSAPNVYRGVANATNSWNTLNNGFGLYWESSSALRFYVNHYNTAANVGRVTGLSPTGTWLFIAGTWDADQPAGDGSTLYLYVDAVSGSVAGTTVASMTGTSEDIELLRTANADTPDDDYNDAQIDEFAVWNVQLSQSDVTRLFNSGTPTDLSQDAQSSNLALWWRCGDSASDSAPTINDESGNGHDGTQSGVTGTATIVQDAPP